MYYYWIIISIIIVVIIVGFIIIIIIIRSIIYLIQYNVLFEIYCFCILLRYFSRYKPHDFIKVSFLVFLSQDREKNK